MKYFKPTYLEDTYKQCYVYDTYLFRFIINYISSGFELEIAYKQEERYYALMFNFLTEAHTFMITYNYSIENQTVKFHA